MTPETPDKLAVFVTEYLKHADQPDAGVIAVTRAGLRDPAWPPSTMAERYLAMPEIQAMIEMARKFYKPKETRDITTATLLDSLEQISQKAEDERQYVPAISARKLQAELLGLIKTKVDFTVSHNIAEMTTAELMKIASRGKTVDGDFKDVTPIAYDKD